MDNNGKNGSDIEDSRPVLGYNVYQCRVLVRISCVCPRENLGIHIDWK